MHFDVELEVRGGLCTVTNGLISLLSSINSSRKVNTVSHRGIFIEVAGSFA